MYRNRGVAVSCTAFVGSSDVEVAPASRVEEVGVEVWGGGWLQRMSGSGRRGGGEQGKGI